MERPSWAKELHGGDVVALLRGAVLIEFVRLSDLIHVEFDAEAGRFGHGDATAADFERLAGESLADLPNPVGVDGRHVSTGGGGDVRHHRQGHVEMVVAVRTPGQALQFAQGRGFDGAAHRPEVAIGQRHVDRLQANRFDELRVIDGDHVRRSSDAGLEAELGHRL